MEETVTILINGDYGVLSLNGHGDEYAYGVPISYAYVDDHIYIHSATDGEKLSRIQEDNRVSFCIVGPTETLPEKFSQRYSSVIVFGKAHTVDGNEKIRALMALVEKYSPDFKEEGRAYIGRDADKTTVVRIDIEHLTGKARK